MNDSLQLGQHLDADTLGAFAEGALPAHEREATLAHLAVCVTCREVLAISLPHVEELQPVAAVPPSRGFQGWRWLWTGAAACAAVGLAAVALLRHPAEPDKQPTMARVEAPMSPPAAFPPAVVNAPPKALPPATARPAPAPQKPSAPGTTASQINPAIEDAAQAKPGVVGGVAGSNAAVDRQPPQAFPQPSPVLAERARSAPAKVPQVAVGAVAPAVRGAAPAGVAAAPSPPPPGQASASAAATETVEVTSNAAVAIDTTNAALAQLLPDLPSHLAATSRYAQGQRVVAADSAGTVFYSKDAGRHWNTVKAPWSGHVVQVGAASQAALPVAAKASFTALRQDAKAGTATLQGLVRDPSGAVIPGAAVSVSGAGASLRVLADRAGNYALRGLAAGDYRLRAEMPGFETAEVTLALTAGQQVRQDLALRLGSASETITVGDARAPKARKAPAFALVTNSGERWLSLDGKSWVREP